jgi:2-methylcitrate dehydratase PrpD
MLVDVAIAVQQSRTMTDAPYPITREIVDFAAGLTLSDIPENVIERGRIHMLDTLGLALAGARSPVCDILGDYADRNSAKGASSCFATARRTAPAAAALFNGTAMHVDNFDDTAPQATPDRNGGLHASAGVLAAIIALAEETGAGGAAVTVAFHAGSEVACKLNHALDARHYQGGFHVTSTLGVFGATVAAGTILGLDREQMASALTFASSRSAGVRSSFGTMVEQMHTGLAAEGGVVAAELAKAALSGSPNVFEAPAGFIDAAAGGWIENAIAGKLGKPWAIIDPGTWIKAWPNGSLVHPAMTLFAELRETHGLKPENIAHVTARTNQRAARTLRSALPKDSMQARFSIPFALATLAIEGRAGIDSFTDETVRRTDIREMMGRIDHVGYDEAGDDYTNVTTFIEIKCSDGTRHEGRADYPLGSPQAPMSYDDVADKIRGCAKYANWPQEKTEALIEAISQMEGIGNIREISALLSV